MVRRKNRVYLPMGTGGLIRYPEEGEELVKLKPKHVIGLVVGIVLLEIVLKFLIF